MIISLIQQLLEDTQEDNIHGMLLMFLKDVTSQRLDKGMNHRNHRNDVSDMNDKDNMIDMNNMIDKDNMIDKNNMIDKDMNDMNNMNDKDKDMNDVNKMIASIIQLLKDRINFFITCKEIIHHLLELQACVQFVLFLCLRCQHVTSTTTSTTTSKILFYSSNILLPLIEDLENIIKKLQCELVNTNHNHLQVDIILSNVSYIRSLFK